MSRQVAPKAPTTTNKPKPVAAPAPVAHTTPQPAAAPPPKPATTAHAAPTTAAASNVFGHYTDGAQTAPGGRPAADAITRGKTQQDQDQRKSDLDTYRANIRKDPRQMTDAEKTANIHANAHLDEERDQKGQVMRKVLPENDAVKQLAGTYGPQVKGSITYAKNTEGMNSHQVTETLGLDYADGKGNTPFLQSDGHGGHSPIDKIHYVDTPMTKAMRKQAKIPIDQSLVDHAQSLTGDKAAQRVLRNAQVDNVPTLDDRTSPKDTANPFNAQGGTATGDRLPNGHTTTNQENKLYDFVNYGRGSKMHSLDEHGDSEHLATLEQNRHAATERDESGKITHRKGQFTKGMNWQMTPAGQAAMQQKVEAEKLRKQAEDAQKAAAAAAARAQAQNAS